MEPLERFLFEQPYLQAGIGTAAFLVALAGWWWARREGTDSRPWTYALAIVAALTIACEATQWAVVTDREQITAQLDRAAVSLEKGDVKTLIGLTDESLIADGRTQEQFANWLEGTLRDTKVRHPSIQRLDINLSSRDEAVANVHAIATIESSAYAGIVSGTWKIEFNRIAGQWKIVELEPVEGASRLP